MKTLESRVEDVEHSSTLVCKHCTHVHYTLNYTHYTHCCYIYIYCWYWTLYYVNVCSLLTINVSETWTARQLQLGLCVHIVTYCILTPQEKRYEFGTSDDAPVLAIRRWGDHMMLMTSLQYHIRNGGDQSPQIITFHILQPLMPCWSVLWVYACTVCYVHTSVLTLFLLHACTCVVNIHAIYCLLLPMLSCMSVIGEYMQCSSRNNSTFHVLHRTPLIRDSIVFYKVFSIPIDIDPSNPECKPHTVLQLMMHAMCIVVEGKRLSGKSVWLILLFWIRYSMCL